MATIFSVTEFTRRVRDLLEGHLRDVWIEGEISNYRKQSSGHHYFTLKDDRAQLACVMFSRAYSAQAGTILRDGVQVTSRMRRRLRTISIVASLSEASGASFQSRKIKW
jgi:exonuclease VII large subunit